MKTVSVIDNEFNNQSWIVRLAIDSSIQPAQAIQTLMLNSKVSSPRILADYIQADLLDMELRLL